MGKVYRFLGLSVGLIVHGMTTRQRQRGLRLPTSPTAPTTSSASTTCATTWSSTRSSMVQRGHAFAIVDEVDSILIDEARTPLIISGQGDKSTELYEQADAVCPHAEPAGRQRADDKEDQTTSVDGDYIVDEKASTATLTAAGHRARLRSTSASKTSPTRRTSTISHHINQAHQGPRHHEAGHRLCGQGRRGHHRRRVHRPPDVSAAATPRACTRPSRPRRASTSTSESQDAGHHHLPELLPHVQQALRHDRYRPDRGGGIPGHL